MIYALGFGIPVLAGLLAAAGLTIALHRAAARDRAPVHQQAAQPA
jgi:hypothetical protein